MHGWLFEDIKVVKLRLVAMLANDSVKNNDTTNTCLINLKIISCCVFSLHIYENPKYHQHEYY